ncbi:MAG TPA: hypothetical protein VJT49_24735 [Amycolatopsis sp.]|uniref:hypothetical protein n=1 Tax=Amycolatopsis sp. TaxID=37632 RepID=UPI002B49D435|nr:hypothetical protein [Amycolatopsis sp.]HKS48257.1 hypothetical protein [Amycolatopsis sp.]
MTFSVTVTQPASVASGAAFTLPALLLDLKAGTSGSTFTPKLAGTGYRNLGRTFTPTATVIGVPVSGSSAGYPSPVLGTTTVS